MIQAMELSLVTAAVGLQQARAAAPVQMAVARKLLETQQQQGSAVVRLIETAGKGAVAAGDALAAAATGLGGTIDTYA
jgi:hypothetical protein